LFNFGGWRGFKHPNINIKKLYSLLNQTSDIAHPSPLRVFFLGGETLNHFSFIEKFIREIPNRHKFSFCLTTNGAKLNKYIIDTLNELHVHVNFSYDRYHADKLNYNLGEFWKKTLILLHDVRVNVCLSPVDDMLELLRLADEMLEQHKENLEFAATPIIFKEDNLYDLNRLKENAAILMSGYRQGGKAAASIVNLLRAIYKENLCLYGQDSSKVCPCGPYPCSFYVDGNLDVYSCVFQPKKIGDYNLPLNFIISRSVGICDRSPKCGQCALKFICLGGCHGVVSEHMCEVMNTYYNPIMEGI
jgi:radical SAM protein with 4Fe4S-binding SPASM domain